MKNNIFVTTIQRVFSLVPGLQWRFISHKDGAIRVNYKRDNPKIQAHLPLAKSLMGETPSVNELSRNTDDFSKLYVLLHFCTDSLPIPELVDGIVNEAFNRIKINLKVSITDRVVKKLEYLDQLTDDGIKLLLKNEYGIETK